MRSNVGLRHSKYFSINWKQVIVWVSSEIRTRGIISEWACGFVWRHCLPHLESSVAPVHVMRKRVGFRGAPDYCSFSEFQIAVTLLPLGSHCCVVQDHGSVSSSARLGAFGRSPRNVPQGWLGGFQMRKLPEFASNVCCLWEPTASLLLKIDWNCFCYSSHFQFSELLTLILNQVHGALPTLVPQGASPCPGPD